MRLLLETGDHFKGALLFGRHSLGGALHVVDFNTALQLVKPSYRQRRFSHIDARDGGASVRQCLAEQSATATHIQYVFAFHVGMLVNPASAQRINVVRI